jgi:hypothetical protein
MTLKAIKLFVSADLSVCLSTHMQSLQFLHQSATSKRKIPTVRLKNHHDAKFEVLIAVLPEASASSFPEF